MQTHVACECGKKLEVSGNKTDAGFRCPRCGRYVSFEEIGGDYLSGSRPLSHESSADAPSSHNTTTIQAGSNISEESGANGNAHVEGSTLITGAGDFVLNNQPAKGSSASPGTGSSTGSSFGSKYDLTERVMHPISLPVVPAQPFAGPNEYEIHRILRVHQRGGMGRILVGYDQYLKREVAIKELHQDVAGEDAIVRRFIGEAETTAQLEHPGIVPIHRLGHLPEGLPYYTMKMVRGETLQEAIKAYHRKPSKPELLNLVRRLVSVSKTLAFAHSKGVIHRDLKPANVMIGEHGETLVMDWGLAKQYGQMLEETYVSIVHRTKPQRPELTMVGSIVGTPAFMSPEQANAEDSAVGPLSDVFALGTVLYYLLAGQTAFAGRSTQEVLSKVRACKPIPPSEIKSNVPSDLEAICLKAMEKLPEKRYQGASEFADDLCRWLDGEPIHAIEDTFAIKIRRWFSQQRISFLGVISVFVLSIIFACIGMWMMGQFRPVGNVTPEPVPVKNVALTKPQSLTEPQSSDYEIDDGEIGDTAPGNLTVAL